MISRRELIKNALKLAGWAGVYSLGISVAETLAVLRGKGGSASAGISYISGSAASGVVVGTTGLSVSQPTGLQDNDVLYALCFRDVGGSAWDSVGWTLLDENQSTAGADCNSAILRKVITSSVGEPSSYTFTNNDTAARDTVCLVITLRGVDNATPEDATPVYVFTQDDSAPDSPSITTATSGAGILALTGQQNKNGGSALTYAAPSGMTLAVYDNTLTWAQGGIAYVEQATAGASGVKTWQTTPDNGVAESHTYTIAVRAD